MIVKRTEEMKTDWNELKVGDRITIGDSEWKVLEVQPDKVLIWKCTNIINRVFYTIFNPNNGSEYEGSDIQKYLQDVFRNTVPTEILDRVTDDGFFLLSEDQIEKYMPMPIDKIVTDINNEPTWYWTSTPYSGSVVRGVDATGYVHNWSIYNSIGVAPACWINTDPIFNKAGFMEWLTEEFTRITPWVYELVENVIDYGLKHENVSKDQFAHFVTDMLPEVEFLEVVRFCEESCLTNETKTMCKNN